MGEKSDFLTSCELLQAEGLVTVKNDKSSFSITNTTRLSTPYTRDAIASVVKDPILKKIVD